MLKERWQRLGLDRKLRALYEKYERVFIPTFLVVGFILDVVTFRALQIKTTLELLGIYVLVAGLTLLYTHIYDARPQPPQSVLLTYTRYLMPFAAQISIGSLLSSSLLFYWYSGSLSVSWPLFALITGVMVSSEVFRQFYSKPAVQLSVYTFVLLSYFSILLPFLLHSLSAWLFMLSGLLSTLTVSLLILLLTKYAAHIRQQQVSILAAVMLVFVTMGSLYFLNLIPPLPLSIREAGIYYHVTRDNGEYTFDGEEEGFVQKLLPGQKIYVNTADTVYAYTAVFAPADLSTTIYHVWEYEDPATGKWVQKNRLHFVMTGGRQEGYRGYTTKTGLTPGKWRVTVMNPRGQVLGRLLFTVVSP